MSEILDPIDSMSWQSLHFNYIPDASLNYTDLKKNFIHLNPRTCEVLNPRTSLTITNDLETTSDHLNKFNHDPFSPESEDGLPKKVAIQRWSPRKKCHTRYLIIIHRYFFVILCKAFLSSIFKRTS